jgi:hypothetical protein
MASPAQPPDSCRVNEFLTGKILCFTWQKGINEELVEDSIKNGINR